VGDCVIQAMRVSNWPMPIRIALVTPVRWRVRDAVMAGDVRSALKLVMFSRRAFGTPATLAVLGSRYDAGVWESVIE